MSSSNRECFRCGISDKEATLYEAVYKTGIVDVCRKCYFKLRIPLIDHKKIDWGEVYRRKSVKEKLQKYVGTRKREEPKKEEFELRDIVSKNFKENLLDKKDYPCDLVDNFHWIIMRKRRSMKISLEEFANKIYEPVFVVDSLEKGILPKDYSLILSKVENFLGVKLRKMPSFNPEYLSKEAKIPSGTLISELKEMNSKKDEILPEEMDLERVNEFIGKPVENNKEDKELTSKDISDLAWGKK